MINGKFKNLDDLNSNIWENLTESKNNYENFLDSLFPNWRRFEKKEIEDNIKYFEDGKLKFSFRIDLKSQNYKHIDIFLKSDVRPYQRIFLKKDMITKYRYYEFNTWIRNYDVIIGNEVTPVYTIEYFNDRERFIDLYYQPGSLFYEKSEFLSYMFQKMES
ncbi:hypothetical protein ACFQGR_03520 [Weissella sagaensis]|uniref:Uncharacterized protein n=1 Tax=Weissella sagaensis TaxID=2559928 RepID=A0ABW1RSN4_9LACO|nr:hypothetical protein [Weissella sagaensis]UEG66751.1 hypothetical protein GZH44_08330 [Weissella hellenica]